MKVIIVGGGQVGAYLAGLLLGRGHTVKLIENRDVRFPALKRDLPEETLFWGNGTEPRTLENAGIREADVVAAVTGSDETNLVVSTMARMEYGVGRVVARVNNPKNAWLFNPSMGVDVGVNQSDLLARLVAEEMSLGDMMTLLKLNRGKYSLVEQIVDPSSPTVGTKVKDLSLPVECVLVAIIREGDLIIPRGDTTLLANDSVIAITKDAHLQELAALLGGIK